MNNVVLSFSGGMDSSVLLYMAADSGRFDTIHTLTFDYGQRHRREIECVDKQIKNLKLKYPHITVTNKVIDVSYISQVAPTSSLTNLDIPNPVIVEIAGDAQPLSYVPFRNMMFISICLSYTESVKARTILYGSAQVDSLAGCWDSTEEWVTSVNSVASLNRVNKIVVEAPLLVMSKADIIREGVKLGVVFKDTWTCYSNHSDGLADATTPSSSLRLQGFIEAGYIDPIKYKQQDKLDYLYQETECSYIP